jgi:hypothetical protein
MCKKLTCLASLALALNIVLTSAADAADPGLVGWWKFEEASGTLFDQSDNNNDGTSFNGVLYQQAGQSGYGLGFDGSDDYVLVGATGRPADTFSFGGWFKTSSTHEIDPESIAGVGGTSGQRYAFDPQHGGDSDGGAGLSVGTNGVLVYEHGSGYMPATAVHQDDIGSGWNHIMIVYDDKQPTIYLNGYAVRTGLRSPRAVVNSPVRLGGMAYGYFEGVMDEIRIYNRALSAAEVKRLGARPEAFNPNPPDGATYADTWATLTWSAGAYAASHDVYMSTSFDDVNDGTGDASRGNVTDAMLIVGFFGFPYPDGLVPGTTYYWRVDEVNDADPNSPWKGNVWSFWIPPRKAYDPDPSDGAEFVDPNVTLSWTAGFGAKLHYIHFGDNFDDVNNAAEGQFVPATTYTPGTLELEKTYYWRVDESDGITTYTGDVWSFKTLPAVPISDPNLLGWWKLDEGYGTMTVDWSGYGSHGVITNTGAGLGEDGSVWDTDPERGIVLSFNGDDGTGGYVSAGGVPEMTLTNDFTWSFWAKQHPDQSTDLAVGGNNLILGNRYSYTGADPLEFVKFTPAKFEFYNNDPDYTMTIDYDDIPSAVWIHHAGVKNGTALTYYRNGIESGTSTITKTIQANPFYMAGEPAGGGRWQGWLSDVRIYDKALTQDQVKETMRGDPALAWAPSPGNGSTPDITEATPLTWSPGDNAAQHDVYFGTDKDAVDAADASDTTGVYRGRQGLASYNPPEGVEWGGGPYYWRIDEFNTDGTISKGRIWSFSVADYLVIDDFESYNDIPESEPGSNLVYLTWLDGFDNPATNGSTIGYPTGASMETTTVHGGRQSVPYAYDNNFKSSQATLTLTSLRNWTGEGVTTLSLWFYGDPANAPERMNVALNGAAPVYHADPSAATTGDWTQWPIDLSRFGVPLTNVDSITIGFGIPGSTAAGGTGDMLFDDILLIR